MIEPAETSELMAFLRTADARSVSRAAQELGLPRATISRRLARLEERLGVRLLRRTTRSLALTDAGEAFYGNARIALDAVQQAEDSVRRDDDKLRGPLRVSLPPIADVELNTMLCTFAREHPDVQLELHYSTHYVDLKRDGFHVALRASMALEPGLVARTLSRIPVVAVASPAYLKEFGTPQSVKDLRSHKCILGYVRGESPETHWPLMDGSKVHVTPSLVSNDLDLRAFAARTGLGITLLPIPAVVEALQKGELVPVLEGILGAEARLAVVYAEREFVPPQVRAFVDALIAWAPGHLRQDVVQSCQKERHKALPRPEAPAKKPRAKRS